MKVIDYETTADKFLISIDKNAMKEESVVRLVKRLRQEYLAEMTDTQPAIQKEYTEEGVNTYFKITNVYGVINQIDADTLEGKPKIKIDGLDYFIYITEEQDSAIRKYYKKLEKRIKFKIKQKISLSPKKIISAELISLSVPRKGNFIDGLSSLSPDTFSSFADLKKSN